MASLLQRSLSYNILFQLGLLELLAMVNLSNGYATYFKPTPWKLAHATFYGDDSASSTMGGACGYGFNTGYGIYTTAISPVLFKNGDGCGSCFQVMCIDSKWCISRGGGVSSGYGGYGYGNGPTSAIVTATNQGPPSWVQPSYGGVHFDLSMPAFKKIAITTGGIIPIKYRRVPCAIKGGIKFSIQGNNYWLLAVVMNVGGAGDIAQMWVKGSRSGRWISMNHNYGASYQAFAQLGGQALSFKLQSYTTSQIITAYNVIPAHWTVGMTYQAKVNFQ